MSETSEKEIQLLLSEKEIQLGDKTVVVKKLSILNAIRLASQLSGIASRVISSPETSAGALSKLMYQPKEDDKKEDIAGIRLLGFVELLDLIGEDFVDVLRDIIVKTTNLTIAEAEELTGDKGIDILFDIYEVNKDFFVKSMNKLKEKLPKVKQQEKEEKSK